MVLINCFFFLHLKQNNWQKVNSDRLTNLNSLDFSFYLNAYVKTYMYMYMYLKVGE